jgi:hypothetical protein
MAPECFMQQMYDERADVFSFALVMWEVLSGALPFGSLAAAQAAAEMAYAQRRPPLPSWAPESLLQLLVACWQQQPHFRPPFSEITTKLQMLYNELCLASGSDGVVLGDVGYVPLNSQPPSAAHSQRASPVPDSQSEVSDLRTVSGLTNEEFSISPNSPDPTRVRLPRVRIESIEQDTAGPAGVDEPTLEAQPPKHISWQEFPAGPAISSSVSQTGTMFGGDWFLLCADDNDRDSTRLDEYFRTRASAEPGEYGRSGGIRKCDPTSRSSATGIACVCAGCFAHGIGPAA